MTFASKAAVAVAAYFPLAYGGLLILNTDPPRWLESIVVALAMPMQLLALPWLSAMRTIGLTEGEWVQQPSFLGTLALALFYGALAWIILRGVRSLSSGFD